MKSAVIILAAGFSSRMGTDKALLDLGGKPVIKRIICSYQAAGIEQIVVVTGQNHTALRQLQLQATLLQNPVPENGMFSSIQTGVAELDPEVEAFFVHPVDTPLVNPETLASLIAVLQQHPAIDGVIPVFQGKRGHPPLLRVRLLPELLQADGAGGLRSLYLGWQMLELASDDQAVILDMNTPEQYAQMKVFVQIRPLTDRQR
jgi:CTP:molybdopterin cytidylyltransferase MocA